MHSVKENTNIVQSNFLIENRPKFTLDETRLFLTIVGAINKDDEELRPFEIPVSEFAELWDLDRDAAYRKIKAALRGLVQKEFFWEGINPRTGKMRFLSASYISAATYEDGAGYATVDVSQVFKPYLLALKKNYTKYVLENVLKLSTVNAIRNYELLKQYETLKKRSFTVEEYKKALKLEDKYARNTDLRVYVIEPAVAEINQCSDILVNFEIKGRGQKAKILFTIAPNKKKAALPPAPDDDKKPDPPQPEDPQPEGATDFELDVMDVIPFEVHNGELSKVRGILDVVSPFIPWRDTSEFLDPDGNEYVTNPATAVVHATGAAVEERNSRIISAIETYVIRDFNTKKTGIKNKKAYYKYFLVGVEGWLMNHCQY